MKKDTKVIYTKTEFNDENIISYNTEGIVIGEIYDENYAVLWNTGTESSHHISELTEIKDINYSFKKPWVEENGSFYNEKPETPIIHELLPVGIYYPIINPLGMIIGLKFESPKFEFPYKIYDLDDSFIKRVEKTFKNIPNNLGILLNGLKGTGKTVMSKKICNVVNTPVIVLTKKIPNLDSFLSGFQQDVCILIDEFEKVYKNDHQVKQQEELLTLMDGVRNSQFKKLFVLTTNHKHLNENLVNRPTRIRYIKEFDNLSLSAINMIVEDMLENKEFHNDLISYISKLEIITVDIVKAIISEINIHQDNPDIFKEIFNVKENSSKYEVKFYNENFELLPTLTRIVSGGYSDVLFCSNLLKNKEIIHYKTSYYNEKKDEYINLEFLEGCYRNNLVDDTFIKKNKVNDKWVVISAKDHSFKYYMSIEEKTSLNNIYIL